MALVVATMTTATRDLLNESTAAYYTDAEIQRWLAEAALEISGVVKCVEATTELALADATDHYALPTTSWEVLHVQHLPTRRGLRKLTPSMAGARDPVVSDDQPTGWWEWNGTLYVEPVPTPAAAGDHLRVYYAELTNAITQLPEAFYADVLSYALYRGLQKDRRYGDAAQAFAAFVNGLAFKRVDVYQRVQHVESDLIPMQETVALSRGGT